MSKLDNKEKTSLEQKSIQTDSLGLIAIQSNSSASTSATNVRNNQILTMKLTKCASANNDQGPGDCALISHPQNANRLSKQAASGDTGDNSCEQVKLNSSSELPINPPSKQNTMASANGGKTSATPLSESITSTHSSDEIKPAINTTTENRSNLIINYLPPNMTQEEVRALFSSIGEVESCKLVREKTSGESLGYAFVKFYNTSDAGKAIKTLNGLRLQNKTVKVSLARPSSEAIKGANLYICGLPRKMTQTDLEKLFSTCGHIITARILYDTKTGLSRGVAFIRYDQRAEAEVAIRKLNGYLPPGAMERITVKFANSPSTNRTENGNVCFMKSADGDTVSKSITNTSYSSSVNQLGKQNMPLSTDPSVDNSVRVQKSNTYHGMSATGKHNNTPPTTRMIKAGNMNGQTTPPGFVFQSAHPNTPSNRVPTCSSGCNYGSVAEGNRNPGTIINQGTACYPPQLISNNLSLQMNGVSTSTGINTNRGEVGTVGSLQRLADVARIKCQAAAVAAAAAGVGFQSPSTMLGGPITPPFPTHLPSFGVDLMRGLGPSAHALLAPAFAASSGALTATGWCIFVYNLAPDTEESILWQLFGPFGAVQTVKVIRDPVTGKCKGFGFVTMSNYEEALLAIHSLNGFNLGNRVLQVSFKTKPNSRQIKFMPNSVTAENIPYMSHLSGSGTPIPNGFTQNT